MYLVGCIPINNNNGIPIFTESLDINEVRYLYEHLSLISIIKDGNVKSAKFIETSDEINMILEKLENSDLETILQLLEKF